MKPNELLDYCGKEQYSQVETKRSITNYLHQDCVIAYDKNKLGVIFIIKGKIKYFGYIALKSYLNIGGYGYDFKKVELNKILSLLGDDCIILDKEEYSKVKKIVIVENL